jgi:hypothetical protein
MLTVDSYQLDNLVIDDDIAEYTTRGVTIFDNVEAEIKSADANDAIRRAEILVTDNRLRSLN